MCYFHEENFVEFFNIISQVRDMKNQEIFLKAKNMISSHLNCISLTSSKIKKYNVKINMEKWGKCSIYDKTKNFDTTSKKIQKDDNDVVKYTDYERFACKKNARYLNISFIQWLSDIIYLKNPQEKWNRIWKKR